MNVLLHWYRTDIRIQDHFALAQAAKNGWSVLPVYFLPEEETFSLSGLPRQGKFRKQFLYQTLQDLSNSWKKQGTELLILSGKAQKILPQICSKYAIQQLSFTSSFASEEIAQEEVVSAAIQKLNVTIHKAFDDFLVHPEDLFCSINEVPNVFTQFRQRCESNWHIRAPFEYGSPVGFSHQEKGISIEKLVQENHLIPDSRTAFPFNGGEQAAQLRIEDYFFHTQQMLRYKETRNGLIGADYSTKFSPWLANGSVSPRTIYSQLKSLEGKLGANESTYWLQFELLWRDYFRYMLLKFGAKLFLKNGMGIYHPTREIVNSESLFQNWITGKTGDKWVDANMQELALTGFMSNRGRQNVASYLVHQLKLDWRLGAEYFESQLIDYDPANNWGNWAYLAGVGNDPRQRVFNMQKQAEQYDPEGEFRNSWSHSE
jgi:deoxyribodipyrimidine photo-lyase